MDANFVETYKVVPVAAAADYSGGTATLEWISMKNAHKATYIITCGSITTGGAVVLGAAASCTASTASTYTVASMDLTMPYYYVGGAAAAGASCDVYTKTTATSSTFSLASTHSSKVIMIEVDASDMGQFTSTSVTYDADYLGLKITCGGSDLLSVVCILTGYRYQEDAPATVLT